MAQVRNDDFDFVAKKYLKLKPIPYDKKENGFDGIFRDQNKNLVIVIKKHDNSDEGFGVDCLLDKEGSMEWMNKKLALETDKELIREIEQSIENKKLRRVLIFHKKYTPIYIISECNENEVWKYEKSEEYYEKSDISKLNGASENQDNLAIEAYMTSIERRKNETRFDYPSKEYVEDYLNGVLGDLLFAYLNDRYIDRGAFWLVAHECNSFMYDLKFLNGDVALFLDGLFTCSRLYFLARKFDNKSKCDLYGLSYLMFSIAINDELAIKSYSDIYANGTGVIASSLNLILNNINDNEKINPIVDKINNILSYSDRSYNKYQKAFYSGLKCILLRDYSSFNENINTLLDLYRYQKDDSIVNGGYIYTCFAAVFLYSLIYFYREKDTNYLPPEPNHFLWDSELWRQITKNDQKRKYNFDVEKVSPLFKKWMDELPEKIDFEELIEELKIKGLKNFPKYKILEPQEEQYFDAYVKEKRLHFGQKYFTKEYLSDLFREKIKNIDEYKSNIDNFDLILDELANECIEYGSYIWCKDGDAESLASAFYTSGRIKYLSKLHESEKSDHLTDLIMALAINDEELVKKIITEKTLPKDCFTLGILALIKHSSDFEEQFKRKYEDKINDKNISVYEKAVLDILNGLILRNNESYTRNMTLVLDNYDEHETQYNRGIQRYIPVVALALHTLSFYDRQKFSQHIEPIHKKWNSNLVDKFLYGGFFRKNIIEIKDISPILKRWIYELPEKIDLNELVESLK